MLQINGKTFMNLQEAVQWLLDNNALPFQSSANYVANTEIGMGTIVNPSPAKVRIGSLIFFADSKVSTVIGLTENGFIVSDQYNDLVDDIVYVSNVALNASGHLIVTLSNGDTIDAGLVKQVSGFSIDSSQHLIVSYNDGSTTDVGAIFSGNVTISGNLTVTGGVSGNAVTGNSIIENMVGYNFTKNTTDANWTPVYVGVCKNGNKITFVVFGTITRDSAHTGSIVELGQFTIPSSVGSNLYPAISYVLDWKFVPFITGLADASPVTLKCVVDKNSNTNVGVRVFSHTSLTQDQLYYFRFEVTFLLSQNYAS